MHSKIKNEPSVATIESSATEIKRSRFKGLYRDMNGFVLNNEIITSLRELMVKRFLLHYLAKLTSSACFYFYVSNSMFSKFPQALFKKFVVIPDPQHFGKPDPDTRQSEN
jgi:hypothetical protein